jgi:hypothetical protein
MSRILFTLATLSLLIVVAAFAAGLFVGDLYAAHPLETTIHRATLHRLLGIAAALAVVFVESVVVTYFIGTSRWCKEVAETYRLDRALVDQSNQLKRRTFPCALAGMLAVIAVIALGAAADPATGRPNTQLWATWHLGGAVFGTLLIAWTYVVAWKNVFANHTIIERLLAEVDRIRHEQAKGLLQ